MVSKNLQQALKLAKHGLRVFPCRGYGDKAKVPIAGIKWTEEATTDEPTIRNWWAKYPKAIPALPAGLNNLLVVDCDLREDVNGINNFITYLESYGFNRHDDLTHVLTPSGGKHFYFKQPKHIMLGNLTGDLPAGIDVRGKGGYVIAFGAVLEDGREYTLKNDFNSLTELPNFLLDTLTSKSNHPPVHQNNLKVSNFSNKDNSLWQRGVLYAEKAKESIIESLKRATKGNRNRSLYNATYRLTTFVTAGLLNSTAVFEVDLYNAGVSIGLHKREVESTIKSAISGGSVKAFDLNTINDKERLNKFTDISVSSESEIAEYDIVHDENQEDADELTFNFSAIESDDIFSLFNLEEYLDSLSSSNFPYTLYPFSGDYKPKGVMEEIIDWVLSNSRNGNVYPLALNVAVSIVSLCASRYYYSPSGSSLHLYTVTLADTGVGKQLLLDSLDDLINAVDLNNCVGSRGFKSDVYLEDVIKNKPRVLCMIDEFGDYFKGINSAKSSTHMQGITEILRSLWGLSKKNYITSGSRSNPSETVYSPCLNIVGASTPKQFFDGMTASNLANGTASRFQLFITEAQEEDTELIYNPSQDYTKEEYYTPPPMSMVETLKIIAGTNLSYDMGRNNKTQPVMTETLKWANNESAFFYRHFKKELKDFSRRSRINFESHGRVAEKAIRLASLFALSRGIDAKVDVPDLLYGLCLAVQSANHLKRKCLFANAGSQHEEKVNLVLSILANAEEPEHPYNKCFTKYGVGKSFLMNRISRKIKVNDLNEILYALVEGRQVIHTSVTTLKARKATSFYRLNRKHPR